MKAKEQIQKIAYCIFRSGIRFSKEVCSRDYMSHFEVLRKFFFLIHKLNQVQTRVRKDGN